ncbi:hypothetical protein CDD80_6544 [Ophiocordyceps camponoti-rufipedis]|uniref:Uncharacterized protein n=1 Tax=Ophiocordyceps camponoti-rufipedis TaxID=2004952 RepID=A0A2C5ZG05_9HYPO|nr:hypothetical protein CDD80_6544 [Ophiocordyceps camponoti-rufipedis]
MEGIKHTLSKVKGDSHEPSGLEKDMQPKPSKVHLAESTAYTASNKLQGKKALISGGDSGIGRSIAILFAMEGAKVAIVYLQAEEEDAKHTKEQIEKNGGEALLIPADLTEAANCKMVVDKVKEAFGGIDILVNNAATRKEQQDICDITDQQWKETQAVNVDSYFYLTKCALPLLSDGGSIINSASVDSYIGVPSRLDYATSKGAIIAFTRGLSNQLVKKGIRVNAVAAGPVWTPLVESGVGSEGQQGHGLGNWTPMNKLGQPIHVATSYVFLASADSEFMSGQTLHPNGGIVVNG